MRRIELLINGIVQGVGFRPFVYRLAQQNNITGFVKNTMDGVLIQAQGRESDIENFIYLIKNSPPPKAKIKEIFVKPVTLVKKEHKFAILKSDGYYRYRLEIPPDIATCKNCVREIHDPKNHRYLYPFTNCVDCGPRFTIIRNLPYDRENTSMNKFKMCPVCEKEYNSPSNRRFHAQTNCCGICGPKYFLADSKGNEIASGTLAIKRAARLLVEGKIIALKGIGGFHIACNAFSTESIKRLRVRKNREEKPFALMSKDTKIIEKYCIVSPVEKEYLLSSSAPIVLLQKKKRTKWCEEIAPHNNYLGIMLPYAPLHYLIFAFEPDLELLVMTSGNYSEQPICTENQQALKLLSKIVDFFLFHDREIVSGCDDSVMRVLPDGKIQMIRRSRGFAPESITLPFKFKKSVLGCGGNMKNTFSFVSNDTLYMSHHIGDIDSPEAFENYTSSIMRYAKILRISPEIVAYDAHPEYMSTVLATTPDFFYKAKKIKVYHHHAHICSCMVENRLENRKVIGIAFDGTGYGQDGTLWGSEFLVCDYSGFERIAHLRPIRLAGSQQAIKEIWRIAIAYLIDTFGDEYREYGFKFLKQVNKEQLSLVEKMIKVGMNSPYSSGMGRFFDAVCCICGIRNKINYEGQAAAELEAILYQDNSENPYEFELVKVEGMYIIDHRKVVRSIVKDIMNKVPSSKISCKFHLTIVRMVFDLCRIISKETDIRDIVLSGGSFQNAFLSVRIRQILEENGFNVYSHSLIPPNDACISVGQCAIAGFKSF